MGQPLLRAAGLGIGTLALAGTAWATGFELREQSAVGQGTAFAGTAARNDDPSMLFFNPASMASLPGLQGAVVGSGIFPTSEPISGSASRNNGTPITGTLGGDIGV